ncbi:MAG: N-acetyl-gamma-glutamyl-phosphate reductase [Cytophagales bacterium]|nr:N-acetyl-gamma-glutamyl-phosphate reductase [Cytophagales bacterium]
MIKAGIIGGAGYTAGELLRILLHHPGVEIAFVNSQSQQGKPVVSIHQDLLGETPLKFSAEPNAHTDVLFVCSGHGKSRQILKEYHISDSTKLIDLSQDFRLTANAGFGNRHFVYGLPEFNKKAIRDANNIANPGCFATAIQLALLPLLAENQVSNAIHVNAITGSTGAGQSLSDTTHYTWRNNNISIYKAFNHQHLAEISETFGTLQNSFNYEINFIPMRGNFTRGIFASSYTYSDLSLAEIKQMYEAYYENAPFTFISQDTISLKQVVNTNKCLINVAKHGDKVLITSIIDNLLKGASGQAVQNMNLMFDMDEKAGLQLKPSTF